jgi:hypothetical protein
MFSEYCEHVVKGTVLLAIAWCGAAINRLRMPHFESCIWKEFNLKPRIKGKKAFMR